MHFQEEEKKRTRDAASEARAQLHEGWKSQVDNKSKRGGGGGKKKNIDAAQRIFQSVEGDSEFGTLGLRRVG